MAQPFAVQLRLPVPPARCCTGSLHPLPRQLPESSGCIPQHSLRVSHAGLQPALKGVYTRQSAINTGAARSARRVARRSPRAPLTGERSPPFLPQRRSSPGPMGGRVTGRRERRTVASSRRAVRTALGWSGGSLGRQAAPSPGSGAEGPDRSGWDSAHQLQPQFCG